MGGSMARCVGVDGWGEGAAEREGVFVCDGQKGWRGWKIPEQSGGVGWRSAHVITREDSGLVRRGGGRDECTCDNEGRQWTGPSEGGREECTCDSEGRQWTGPSEGGREECTCDSEGRQWTGPSEGGREECTCDNEGRQWTGPSEGGE